MSKLRVLLLTHELSRTGAPKVALDALTHMEQDVEVRTVAAAGGPLESRCRQLGPLLVPFAAAAAGRFGSRLEWWRRRRTWAEIRAWRPHLVYVNSVASLPLAARLEQNWGWIEAPLLLHVHELESHLLPIAQQMPDWLLHRPRRYIAVSGAVERCLREACSVAAQRIETIPEFVVEREFTRPSERERSMRQEPERHVVGGAGNPGWRKGTTLWLQMAQEIQKPNMNSKVRCAWLGVPACPGEPMRLEARRLGLEGRVELLPPTDDPLSVLSNFDVLALTSWEDPCPLVVLEAMMLGKPVACFAGSGGATEQVGDIGVVVEAFSPAAMASAVTALLADGARRRRLGAAARQRVLEHFTDRTVVPWLLRVFREVAQSEQ